MSRESAKSLETLLRQHEAWLLKSGDFETRELGMLRQDLDDGSVQALANVGDSLGFLALFYGTRGEVAAIKQDAGGWHDISRSVNYRHSAVKLRVQLFSRSAFMQGVVRGPNLTNAASSTASLLCAALAAGREDMRKDMHQALAWMSSTPKALDDGYWKRRHFEPFALWLSSKLEPAAPPVTADFGAYKGVVESWQKPQDLAAAMTSVCDYHCKNMDDRGGAWDPEFKNVPFDLLPFEVHAIRAARDRLGLETPPVDHPLLSLPTADISRLTWEPDSVLERVEELMAG